MMQERKPSFICPRCKRADELPPSVISMQGNYGSREHDTERATVELCGDCFDWLYAIIESNLPAGTIEVDFTL